MRWILLACLLLLSVSCAQTMAIRVDKPAHVVIDGEKVGLVEPGALVEVDLMPGVADVPYEMQMEGQRYEGTIEREGFSGLFSVAAVAGACCGVPTCVSLGLCASNPTLLSAPFCGLILALGGWTVALDAAYGCLAGLCLSPGWLTGPSACGGLAAGTLPLALFGLRGVPDVVVLTPSGALSLATWERGRENPLLLTPMLRAEVLF